MTGRALLPLVLLAAACSSEPGAAAEGAAARLSEPIVNGTPSPASDDSVVYIAIGTQGEFCTGTLITPNLVITARHCVSAMDESSECGTFTTQSSPSTMSISVGPTPGAKVATAKAIFVDTAKGNSGCSNDIALFQVDHDIPNAKISPVRFTALTVGEAARTAGFGDDGSGTPTSTRYQKTGIKIDSVGPASYSYKTKANKSLAVTVPPGEIVTGESTCFGDSGGPLFDGAGNVIGVTSRGIDEECKDRPSIYSDTATHQKLITDAAAAAGHALSAPGSTPQDPNTNPDGDPTTNDPTASDQDSSGDDGTDAPATKPKKKSTLGAQAGSGCSAAPRSSSSGPAVLLGALALGAALSLRRRRRD